MSLQIPILLVTGHDGFVGSYFNSVAGFHPFQLRGGDVNIRQPEEIQKLLQNLQPHRVLHLAAQSFVPRSFEDPGETFDVNFSGTLNLLQSLAKTGFTGRLLYVGSGDMYGMVEEENLPIQENHPLKPRNPYAVSKVAAEALCYQWSCNGPFEIIMVRPFNHIGPGQSPDFVISNFAKQIIQIKAGLQEPHIEVGDIDVTRDFTDVRDVVAAYMSLFEKGENGEVYNVSSGNERRIRDILTKLIALADVDVEIRQDAKRLRKAEQRRVVASSDKLNQTTGWCPKVPWDQTLKSILSYWEKHLDE